MQIKKIFFLIIFLLFLGVVAYIVRPVSSSSLRTLTIGNQSFQVEVADTNAEREQGLSGRQSIGSDGLLFIFDEPTRPPFWMKEMLFDLDFIWISQGKVVETIENIPAPLPTTPLSELPTYAPQQNVDQMLEVPAGFAEEHNIKIGDSIILK